MKKYLTLVSLLALFSQAGIVQGADYPTFSPRLGISGSASVWSPGGSDGDLFQASMGWGVSLLYWFNTRNQVQLRGTYTLLAAREDFWAEKLAPGMIFDAWDVDAKMWSVSLELRRLFPTDRKNYLYIGGGADLYIFETIEGRYEIYQSGLPETGVISDERVPSLTGGFHFVPGMFIVLNKRLYLDVSVKAHFMIDGIHNPYWLEPCFALSYRIL